MTFLLDFCQAAIWIGLIVIGFWLTFMLLPEREKPLVPYGQFRVAMVGERA